MAKKIVANTFVSGLGNDICSPFFDENGVLHVIRQNTGGIMTLDGVGNAQTKYNTGGQPSSATYSPDGVLYLTDFGHAAVLAYTPDGRQECVVGVYEDRPLKGPNSVAIVDGDIFFTDSGAFGETGIHSPTGSLFTISNSPSGQILKPISLGNLAYPAGIAISKDKKFIFVAETMQNRVLRFFQQPLGVYHGSVFYQFSGGVGPSSLTIDDNGNLYVGHSDIRDSSADGTVYVLSTAGKLQRTISTPGPEISGLALRDNILYITEKSNGAVLKADLS